MGSAMPTSAVFSLVRRLISPPGVRGNVMRKYLASLAFAMTLSAAPVLASTAAATDEASATVAAQQVKVPLPGLRDEAAMVLVGTALIGLGAAVRRSA
jgi:hypothetical protein